tara:strand:- start:95 stop:715 length:621 start_codon:yes stop_codon:yes gene_type:complete
MTDKELFEKTEKVFNLKKKNKLIEKIYDKGKFKQTLLEQRRSSTSPIRSNYAKNTTSAAATAGRGLAQTARLAGKGVGATAKGLGKFGKFLNNRIPGTKAYKDRKAETDANQAIAKAERLKNVQMQQKMMFGGGNDKPDKKPAIATPKKTIFNYKVGDVVLVNTKKGGKKQAVITQIRPDELVQLALRNGPTYMGNKVDVVGKVKR